MMTLETGAFLRSADVLRRILSALLVLLIAAGVFVLWWLMLDPAGAGRWLARAAGYDDGLAPLQGAALGGVLLAQIGVWIAVVWQARTVFEGLLRADAVAASAAARRLAWFLWAMLLWGIVSHALASVITTWHYPVGTRTLAISIGTGQITTLLAALLAGFTSHAFALGAALWQDHREVI